MASGGRGDFGQGGRALVAAPSGLAADYRPPRFLVLRPIAAFGLANDFLRRYHLFMQNILTPKHSTYTVSFCFEGAAAQRLVDAQKRLAQICGNNFLIEHSVPPHVTLGVFHAEPCALPQLQKAFDDFAKLARGILGEQGLDLEFGGADSFLDKVLFLALKKDSPSFACVKRLNEILHQKFLPLFEAGDNRNYLPERWLPHAALAVKLTPSQFEKCAPPLGLSSAQGGGDSFGLATDSSSAQIELPQSARVAALSLALCKPYKEICRVEF